MSANPSMEYLHKSDYYHMHASSQRRDDGSSGTMSYVRSVSEMSSPVLSSVRSSSPDQDEFGSVVNEGSMSLSRIPEGDSAQLQGDIMYVYMCEVCVYVDQDEFGSVVNEGSMSLSRILEGDSAQLQGDVMCVCMYVCMYVCCMYVCVFVCLFVCMYVCVKCVKCVCLYV